ncbi:hypothetical protein E2542_SST08448 [Spatholobus suberectus]|nr:hypothetical protein E2542_SST08448 [Spatholobus suberectus]
MASIIYFNYYSLYIFLRFLYLVIVNPSLGVFMSEKEKSCLEEDKEGKGRRGRVSGLINYTGNEGRKILKRKFLKWHYMNFEAFKSICSDSFLFFFLFLSIKCSDSLKSV